ncbi:MAG: twin-arginine translocase subunit TatC [Terrimicrobiaceae bacterium]
MNLERIFGFRESADEPKPLLDHLEDLRGTIIRIAAAIGIGMLISFTFRTWLAAIVQQPLANVAPDRAANLQSLGVADSFTISLELAFYSGFVLAFPAVLFFLAEFVLPALTPKEKKILFPAAFAGFFLFMIGVLFCYFVVLPQTLAFFFHDARSMNWQPTWTVREYYSFTTQFVIAFGLAFQLPLAVLVLVKAGVLDLATLQRTRAFALVVIFVIAAIITPTSDILTLALMGGPMYLLYELCIVIARILEARDRHRND